MIALAVIAVVVAVLVVAAYLKGQSHGRDDEHEGVNKSTSSAKIARDRLLADREYAKRMRDKYTRE